MNEHVGPEEEARHILQAILDDLYPLSDELFRQRSWVRGANPGFFGSSLTEVVSELDWKIPYLTGELASHSPLTERERTELLEFHNYFMRFIDERMSEKIGNVGPREELADHGWIEVTRRAKNVLEDIVRLLDDGFRLPPNFHRQ